MLCKKVVFRNSPKFTGKHLCQGLFLIKLQAACRFIIYTKEPLAPVFHVNLVKFLRTPILKNRSNRRDWRKTSKANLAYLYSIKVSGSSVKGFSEKHYLKAVKLCYNEKIRKREKSGKERLLNQRENLFFSYSLSFCLLLLIFWLLCITNVTNFQ